MTNVRIMIAFTCFILAACSSVPPKKDAFTPGTIVWPPPPILPRIVLSEIIRTPQDAGIKQSFWHSLKNTVFGEEDFAINRAYGIYADCRHRILLVDSEKQGVHLFDRRNGKYHFIQGPTNHPFISPIGITEDTQEHVYVTDSATGIIYRFDMDDLTAEPFITQGIKRPTGIAFNPTNNLLYVVDTISAKIIAYDLAGHEVMSFGDRGTEPGRFNHPSDIAIDINGRVLITDSLNNRIQIFSSEGAFLKTFGDAGDAAGHFAKPKGVAVDSDGHIYVCDALFDSVQIFNEKGQLLLDVGNTGNAPGEFWMPSGIFVDKDDTIYVVDTYNQRIQVFTYLWEGWSD